MGNQIKNEQRILFIDVKKSANGKVGSKVLLKKTVSILGQIHQYIAYMTDSRLEGYCEVIILDQVFKNVEKFTLYFSEKGMVNYFKRKVSSKMLQEGSTDGLRQIDYSQALGLIGDSVKQNYKYNTNIAFLEKISSIHLQRAWFHGGKYEMYSRNCLPKLDMDELIHCCLKGVQEKDAALLYDLCSQTYQQELGSRELYLYHWHHLLEEVTLIRSDKSKIVEVEEDGRIKVSREVIAIYEQEKLLELQLVFYVRKERESYRLDGEIQIEAMHLEIADSLNPLKTNYYVSEFRVEESNQIKEYLMAEDKVIVSGEFDFGTIYMWFNIGNTLKQGINLSQRIYSQMLLSHQSMMIFSEEKENIIYLTAKFKRVFGEQVSWSRTFVDTKEQIYLLAMEEFEKSSCCDNIC